MRHVKVDRAMNGSGHAFKARRMARDAEEQDPASRAPSEPSLRLIHDALKARGWTRASLGRRLGHTPQYATDIFKGKKDFDCLLAVQIEAVLGVSAEELILARLAEVRASPRAAAALKIIGGLAEVADQQDRMELVALRFDGALKPENVEAFEAFLKTLEGS